MPGARLTPRLQLSGKAVPLSADALIRRRAANAKETISQTVAHPPHFHRFPLNRSSGYNLIYTFRGCNSDPKVDGTSPLQY